MSQKVISFHYTLSDSDGVVLENSQQGGEPITFVAGVGMIVPGLEKQILDFPVGEKRKVEVSAEEAYGLIDFNKYVQVPLEALGKPDVKVGDVFRSNASPTPFTVKQVEATHVVLDGNHPLAGEDLVFDVEILENREATEEEVKQLEEHFQQMAQSMLEAEQAALEKAKKEAEGDQKPE